MCYSIKNKIIKINSLLLLVLMFSNCADQRPQVAYTPDDAYVSMMTDLIFANKVHSKIKYSERDSTMLSLMGRIEEINGRTNKQFDEYVKSIQEVPDHYHEFLDSVDALLKQKYTHVQALKDSSQSILPKGKEQLDTLESKSRK